MLLTFGIAFLKRKRIKILVDESPIPIRKIVFPDVGTNFFWKIKLYVKEKIELDSFVLQKFLLLLTSGGKEIRVSEKCNKQQQNLLKYINKLYENTETNKKRNL